VAACTEAGIAVEVVPGVTSATAGAIFAGLPLTNTVGAAGFSVVSEHLDPDDPANRIDWSALSRSGTTIVLLMGMHHLAATVDRLLVEGVAPEADAACIADVSLPTQRSVRAQLSDLPRAVSAAGLTNPATVIVDARREVCKKPPYLTTRRRPVRTGPEGAPKPVSETTSHPPKPAPFLTNDRVAHYADAPWQTRAGLWWPRLGRFQWPPTLDGVVLATDVDACSSTPLRQTAGRGRRRCDPCLPWIVHTGAGLLGRSKRP
jgi:Tetrapyrrole (Corrin/Porphyrin) Methylases